MTIPAYNNTNLIISYLIKIELILSKINALPIPKNYIKEFQEDQASEDIEALSKLIDHPIGYEEARKVYLGKILPSSRSKFLIFINYRNTIEFAKNYDRRHFMPPSSELMLHINSMVGNKIGDDWSAGNFRTFTDKPDTTYDSWIKLRDYYPTVIFEEHFNEIMTTLFYENKTQIHEIIRLAILIYEMIDKAPFTVTNQISTIALLWILSGDMKKNPNHSIPFAKIINYIRSDLENGFKISKQHRDMTTFLEAFLYSFSIHLMQLEDQYKDIYENKVKKHGKLNEMFNKRQLKILDYLDHSKKISRDEVAKMMGVSFMTAYRDLKGLLDEGYIEQKGTGRGTYYSLIDRSANIEIDVEKLEVFSDLA